MRFDPEMFWALTPYEFRCLHTRHLRERYRISAHVCATLANIWRDPEKRSEPFTVEDMMPPDEDEPDDDEMPADPLAVPRAFGMLMANAADPDRQFEDLTKGVTIEYRCP